MNRPTFTDLPPELQETYGNGCGGRKIPVPDFNFTASCRHHDFNYERGCGANYWYENLWKAPYYYTKANWNFLTHMVSRSSKWWHYPVAALYATTVQLISWPLFNIGHWRSIEVIVERDRLEKEIKRLTYIQRRLK
jgi:hypothetical protein